MTIPQSTEHRPLRLWPGVVAVTLQWLLLFGLPIVMPDATPFGMIGAVLGGLAVLVWWLFFSRAPQAERWAALALMILAALITPPILHASIRGGMMGMMFGFFVIPTLSLGLVIGAVTGGRLAAGPRRATLAVAILLGSGGWALMRTDGVTGVGHPQLAWRWAKTPEQQLLVRSSIEPVAAPTPPAKETAVPVPAVPSNRQAEMHAVARPAALATAIPTPKVETATGADWPGFRGVHRDDTVTGVRIRTDWASSPPVELWRKPVGPGWSSFAVHDGRVYTQEQRGDFEVVACYSLTTGEPVWIHRDATRFWESNGGAGPRATPTFAGGRVYTFGATGILNALNARDGAVVWTRNAAADAGVKTPEWGFASSPLVLDDAVMIAVAGRLASFDRTTGDPRWLGPVEPVGYSSPHLATLDGVQQVLLMTGEGVISVAPADGKVLWKYPFPSAAIVQPALTGDGGVLITSAGMTGGTGIRRLAIAQGPAGWTAEERWTSTGLKPYFNDFVVHNGHAFGFDGSILSCIDLQDGKRNWKGGRYGYGQMLLLADQDLLLVVSEEGELALVAAKPDQFTAVARVPSVEGKTWNHPVLAGDILLVRNGQEMVAFRLTLAGS